MFTSLTQWFDDRTGLCSLFSSFVNWSMPAERGICRYLPPMIVFGYLTQILTGLFLWVHYSTNANGAWESIFFVQYHLSGGWLVRAIHHYCAQFTVFLLGMYFLSMVFRGRYRTPREFVFWTGTVLLLFSLASCLTGDLLTWTLNGYSATKVRVSFLQMLPVVGTPLYKIVAGGSDFGTLTIPRFLVLHVLVFGGGGFGVTLLWRFFAYRAGQIILQNNGAKSETPVQTVSFWSNEVLRRSIAALVFSGIVLLLVYQKPLLQTTGFTKSTHETSFSTRGAELAAPASPPDFYPAARPEWSFRALFHFAHLKVGGNDVFPGTLQILPIFIIPTCVFVYVFLIPIIGRVKVGHLLNVLVIFTLFAGLCFLTCISYYHDFWSPEMADFRNEESVAAANANRVIELCLSPTGIPPEGAAALMKRDPKIQGAILFERHCSSCHPFQPLESDKTAFADFHSIKCDTPTAPNLYNPIRKEWMKGWLDRKQIKTNDYYANTKFLRGTMVTTYMDGTFRDIMEDAELAKQLDTIIDILLEEAKQPAPRNDGKAISEDRMITLEDFGCAECHQFYTETKPTVQSPDLRGYMSRQWMIDFISNPSDNRFYGKETENGGNDRMMAYKGVLTTQEIEVITDWLRGNWYRPNVTRDEPQTVQTEEPTTTQPDNTMSPMIQLKKE
ncbi:MAG: cytochrome b N-terminal domain-containing protein [Planctomycetaceae bacterium]|jgi:ubiquinol-cytochrome c reductase cytochrome b subunit|nr:cytochrome b N-terminal domain-containing protein [Planctomycetaceae bacterium]